MVDLRARAKEIERLRLELDAELQDNVTEQERVQKLLVDNAKVSMRLKSVQSKETARGTLARLGLFTMSEATAELGWDAPRVRKLIEAMACEKPPAMKTAGKLGTKPMWEYVGPPIDEIADTAAEKEAAALEAVQEWVTTQNTTFSPAICATAIDLPRATTLRALRALQGVGAVVDEGPTLDMPIFRRTGLELDVAIDRPRVAPVVEQKVWSKIPHVQELCVAADNAGCSVDQSNGHLSIETLDGRRVHIEATPNRRQLLEDKARLRRIGVNV